MTPIIPSARELLLADLVTDLGAIPGVSTVLRQKATTAELSMPAILVVPGHERVTYLTYPTIKATLEIEITAIVQNANVALAAREANDLLSHVLATVYAPAGISARSGVISVDPPSIEAQDFSSSTSPYAITILTVPVEYEAPFVWSDT